MRKWIKYNFHLIVKNQQADNSATPLLIFYRVYSLLNLLLDTMALPLLTLKQQSFCNITTFFYDFHQICWMFSISFVCFRFILFIYFMNFIIYICAGCRSVRFLCIRIFPFLSFSLTISCWRRFGIRWYK